MEDSWKHDDEAWAKLVREAVRDICGALIVSAIIALTLFLWLWA